MTVRAAMIGSALDRPAVRAPAGRYARRSALAATLVLGLALSGCGDREASAGERLVVFSAASLRDAMTEVAELYRRAGGAPIDFNFAGSNVLALQIEAAPVADVFLSADESWMDRLERTGRVDARSRRAFLSNRLTIIAHRHSALALAEPADLATAKLRYLSMGDPAAVPAGRYARAFLERVPAGSGNLWEVLRQRVAPAPDSRAALALVEADESVAGIVYRSDAQSSERVRVVLEVAPELTPPIRYVAAMVAGTRHRAEARRWLDFLSDPGAVAAFARLGFAPLEAAEAGRG